MIGGPEVKLTTAKIKDLKPDHDNPNMMTETQINGLRESMKKWGYLSPIIIDQNKKIIDGEHRFHIFKETYGDSPIPVIQINAPDEQERRLLRQTMNKVRGQHDLNKDIREIQIIMSKDKHRESIKRILQISQEKVNKMKSILEKERTIERNTRVLDQDKRLTFFLQEKEFELVTETLDKLSQNKNEALIGLCNDWNQLVGHEGKEKKSEKIKLRQKQLARMKG